MPFDWKSIDWHNWQNTLKDGATWTLAAAGFRWCFKQFETWRAEANARKIKIADETRHREQKDLDAEMARELAAEAELVGYRDELTRRRVIFLAQQTLTRSLIALRELNEFMLLTPVMLLPNENKEFVSRFNPADIPGGESSVVVKFIADARAAAPTLRVPTREEFFAR